MLTTGNSIKNAIYCRIISLVYSVEKKWKFVKKSFLFPFLVKNQLENLAKHLNGVLEI